MVTLESGGGTYIILSNRPGRVRASSNISGRFVAATTNIFLLSTFFLSIPCNACKSCFNHDHKSRKFTAEIWWLSFPIISQLSKIRNRSVKFNILYIYTLTCELCPSRTLSWLESNFSSSLIPIPSISFRRVDSTLSWTLRWLEESPLFPIMESTSSKNIIEGAPALALWKICNNKNFLSVTEYQIHVQFCTPVLGIPVLSFICNFFVIFTSKVFLQNKTKQTWLD